MSIYFILAKKKLFQKPLFH